MGNPPELYYRILNISRDTSPKEIRAAYKTLVRQWHPDKHPPSSKNAAEARFKAITEAYEVRHANSSSSSLSMVDLEFSPRRRWRWRWR